MDRVVHEDRFNSFEKVAPLKRNFYLLNEEKKKKMKLKQNIFVMLSKVYRVVLSGASRQKRVREKEHLIGNSLTWRLYTHNPLTRIELFSAMMNFFAISQRHLYRPIFRSLPLFSLRHNPFRSQAQSRSRVHSRASLGDSG